MDIGRIDLEIAKQKKHLKDLKALKSGLRKQQRIERISYKPSPLVAVGDWVDSICCCFENIVNR